MHAPQPGETNMKKLAEILEQYRAGERELPTYAELRGMCAPIPAWPEQSKVLWDAVTRLERQDSTYAERMAAADGLRALAAVPASESDLEVHMQRCDEMRDALFEARREIDRLSNLLAASAPVSGIPDLLAACRNLIEYLDERPPMGDGLWCVQQIRVAVSALPAPQAPDTPNPTGETK
jgi:hypothetical protein